MEWFKKNKIFIATTVIVIMVLITLDLFLNPIEDSDTQTSIKINGHALIVEIADTQKKQIQGLSNRKSLHDGTGMLFMFNDYKQRTFWMKDMQFNIDIVWIRDNQVIDLIKNVPIPTSTSLLRYTSTEQVNVVLELNSGATEKYNIKPGDILIYN